MCPRRRAPRPWGFPDLERLRDTVRVLADALVAVHRRGIVHRDVKPQNVMVTDEGRVVLLDFGIAISVDAAGANRTDANLAVGTPAYMAPEQLTSEAVTEAADWYAVGAMLFEALAGRLLRHGLFGSTEGVC